MKICAFSDIHGNIDFAIEPCDIVFICGDIVPTRIERSIVKSEVWFTTVFIPWCTNLPCEKVVFIGGNHDFILYENPERIRILLEGQDKVIYLDCELFEFQGKTIFGTPWCKPFGNWAFMEECEMQDKRYERYVKAIEHIDILLSHDAPYGTSDILLQKKYRYADGSHIGNKSLTSFIEKTQPDFCFHGHLHSTNHDEELLKNSKVFNTSLLDEFYKIAYKPLYIEID